MVVLKVIDIEVLERKTFGTVSEGFVGMLDVVML